MSNLGQKFFEAKKIFKKPKKEELTTSLLNYINNHLKDYSLKMNVFINEPYLTVDIIEEKEGSSSYSYLSKMKIEGKSVEEIEKIRIYLMYFMMGVGLEEPQEEKYGEDIATLNSAEYNEIFMALNGSHDIGSAILSFYKVDHLSLIKRVYFKDCLQRINLLQLTRR